MRLKSIKLRNFLSYARQEISFTDTYNEIPKIYIISGINKDASSSEDNSNGSGKSTLVGEAVSFNIFGKNLRGSSKKIKLEEAIKFGEGTMINEVEYFIDSGNILKIRREKEREGKNNLEVTVDGESKTKRLKRLSENDIREFMGIDPDVYYQTVSYYKDNTSLLAMAYNQRLDFFKKLVNLSVMDEYYLYCKKFKTETDKKLIALKAARKSQVDIITAISDQDSKYQKIIEEAISVIENDILELEKKSIPDDSKLKEKESEFLEEKENIDSDINSFNNQNRIDKVKLKEYEQDIKKFTKLKNTECSSCGQLVTGEYADKIIESKKELKIRIEEDINKREEEIEEKSKKSIKLDAALEKLKEKIKNIQKEKTVRKVKLDSLNDQLKKKKKELSDFISSLSTDTDTNVYEQKIKKLDKAIKILKRKIELNDFWMENLTTKSPVRSAILRKHINIISDIFEYYVGRLFRSTFIGKMEINDTGDIDILLKTEDNDINYWSLSSGERKRADIAILFAVYTYIVTIVPNVPKFILLDEIFDSLDHHGKECVTEVIFEIYQKYQIDIFIITHIDFPSDIFSKESVKKILVTKEDNESSAEFV